MDLVGLKPMKCAGGIIGNNGITVLSHDEPVPSFLCFFLSSIKLPQGNVRFRRAHAHACTHKLKKKKRFQPVTLPFPFSLHNMVPDQ